MTPTQTFLHYLRTQRRCSPRTYSLYGAALQEYYAFLFADRDWSQVPALVSQPDAWEQQMAHWPLAEADYWEVWQLTHLRSFLAWTMERGLSATTVNLKLSALSAFCTHAVKAGQLRENPLRLLTRPKRPKRLPEFYKATSLEDYFACFAAPDRDWDFSFYRNKMLLLLLYATGMRRSEVVGLRVSDFDVARSLFRITGKGGKEREIPVPIRISQEIVLYLKRVREEFPASPTEWFFVTDQGNPLYPQFVNSVVKKELAGLDGFSGKKSPHVLRHSLATHLLNNGTDLNSIKEVLGHGSLAATQVYTHNSFEKLKETYLTAHPRAKNGGKYGH
ncbi:MAG: tyrosine-type recombinase/integrase [Bacteroidales bacterium]|nr:tyrosine-type recombinase/integrase [Bacteroidales bacterium]